MVAVALGWLILNERVTLATLAGAALVVGSVAAVVRHESPSSGPAPDDRVPPQEMAADHRPG